MFVKNRLGMTESVETLLMQEQRLNQISNNLANVDTAGYKKDNVTFWEMLYTASDNRQRVGKGVKNLTDYAQGVMDMTANPLDIAISGNGYFKIQTPSGVRYSRAGNFQLNSRGQLSTGDGNLVLGDGGPIALTNSNFEVSPDGRIVANGATVGKLAIVNFTDPRGLIKEGANLFRPKNNSVQEDAAGDYTVKQGFLEKSNVNSVVEMTEMIDLHRAYESQQKVITTIDEIDDQSIRRVGKLTA